MNPHFRGYEYLPQPNLHRAYARLDHIETQAASGHFLLAFDLVDADWLDNQGAQNRIFDMDHPERRSKAWKKWEKKPRHNAQNPFDTMPVFRLELEVRHGESLDEFFRLPDPLNDRFRLLERVDFLEKSWFEFEVFNDKQPDSSQADLYASMFTPSAPVYIKGKMPSHQKGTALTGIFSLTHLPKLPKKDFEDLLSDKEADLLAVYDVGQGNANAILSEGRIPTLYYDLGAGVYRNQRTTPYPLAFCFTAKPPIVLSHWDADHWAGAYAFVVGDKYPALERTWIAPDQTVGPVHVAFAYDVLINGGKFFIYSASIGDVGIAPLLDDRQIKFTLGKGPDRNDTGIVLAVEEINHRPHRSWLLTGDCDYLYFVNELHPNSPVGIVVPHHGADLDPRTLVPTPPTGANYKRLIYSFGPNNRHGGTKVRHPTDQGMAIHNSVDWDHNNWNKSKPGESVPGGDVLATCEHQAGGYRGGVLVGWDGPPILLDAPCGSSLCKTPLTQA